MLLEKISLLELFSYAGAILSAGIAIGYKIGENKVVTTEDVFCKVLEDKQVPKMVKVIYLNSKRRNNNCAYYNQSKKQCTITHKRCILI